MGTLIVDRATVVRFANPAAALLLGVPAAELVGQAFGLPLTADDGVTDINVSHPGAPVRTLAMRATRLPSSGHARLITLFDVSGRTRRYEYEHRLVESLQRGILLDALPQLPGVSLAARYLPGEGEVQVGGDWYDAIELPNGRLGLTIGDVAGHGIESAALMSQLRNALRAYALEVDSPAAVLARLDRLLHHFEPAGMATAVYVTYDPDTKAVTYAAAGHPYPLLLLPDGQTTFLEGGRSMPLGTGIKHDRPEDTAMLPPGSMLVLYTDGLVERRSRSLDEGLAELASSLSVKPPDPSAACDRILSQLLDATPPEDDVGLLIMSTSSRPDCA